MLSAIGQLLVVAVMVVVALWLIFMVGSFFYFG
jgi:hypothetical protein